MKYIVVLGDGMADYAVPELKNRTPLQSADLPFVDSLARRGTLGMVKTVPEGMSPGSDTANLSVMGYDPCVYYSGRSPFEAASMGIPMAKTDITFRCNLVTLSDESTYEERVMLDHGADEISSAEAKELIAEVDRTFGTPQIKFYPGVSYRHLMVWENGPYDWRLTPPHDILGKKIADFLPAGKSSETVAAMMKKSVEFLAGHPVNRQRRQKGLRPANSIWIWGEGKKPLLSGFTEKYGLKGAVISAVDLIKGIGICAGLESIDVPGATGTIHSNFRGKAEAALAALQKGLDFVYIHLEAPDECGHRGEINNKVKAIELIDREVVGVLRERLDATGEAYKLMFLPDHATPLSLRTHTSDPVPFLIYDSSNERDNPDYTYDERCAAGTGLYVDKGYRLIDFFLKNEEASV
ncbi:MAG: cofactor-independent phosphoglycerate mutase [Clostridiales bacterium]|nr:cofactor-independent phosphoglycerate mutase [Clostridiales bacterium]